MTSPPTGARRATIILVVVTVLWGLSFPLVKTWQLAADEWPGGKILSSLTLIAVRMVLALAILGAFQPRLLTQPTRREHLTGAAVGVVFFFGFVLQVWGMAHTSPATSAFITSLGSAWVPLLAFVALRVPVAGVTLLGIGVGVAGTAVLGLNFDDGFELGTGEILTLVSSGLFAFQILLLDRLGKQVRSAHMTMGFLGVAALLGVGCSVTFAAAGVGLGTWWLWLGDMLQKWPVLRDLTLLTLLPTVLAFHWMNVYQPQISAGKAAVIYLLEPVFTAIFSVLWGYDPVTGRLFLGGGMILAGNMLVEAPYWVMRWKQRGR